MVLLKIAAILAFVFVGMRFIHPANYHPFVPEGWSGVLTGGSIIFFTYIGFDSVSTAAEEARNPQRDIPIGIIATLIVCTVLYIAVAVVLTGIVPWQIADRRRRSRGEQHEHAGGDHQVRAAALDRTGRAVRRDDGHDLVAAGVSAGAGAGVVLHVARRPAAQHVQPRASALPHAGDRDLDCRIPGRHSRGHSRYRHAVGPVEHRHAVCVCAGVARRDHSALQAARSPSRISARPAAWLRRFSA